MRVGAVLVGLWLVGLVFALLFPLAFPVRESASFFSTTLVRAAASRSTSSISTFRPTRSTRSPTASCPAVVLFAVVLGVAMIGIERKQVLLDVLAVASALVSRATRFVVQLTPYGMFAIAAVAAGTLQIEQLGTSRSTCSPTSALALLVALWVLPGLVAALTPIRYGELLSVDARRPDHGLHGWRPLHRAADPDRVVQGPAGAPRHHRRAARVGLPDVIVPASFNFPHTGKLLSVSFILFAGWFADAAVRLAAYPRLLLTGLLTFFGSLNAAVPFLLDMFRIPADTFQLYLATGRDQRAVRRAARCACTPSRSACWAVPPSPARSASTSDA